VTEDPPADAGRYRVQNYLSAERFRTIAGIRRSLARWCGPASGLLQLSTPR